MVTILPENLKYDVTSILKKNQDVINNIEIEIRIRDPKKDSKIQFLEENLTKDGYNLEEVETIDYLDNGKRTTYRNGQYFNTSKTDLIKPRIFKEQHDIKFSISKEELTPSSKPKNYSMVRNKKRKSFTKDNFTIDITLVNDKNIELEIEVLKASEFIFEDLNKLLDYLFGLLFDRIIEDFTQAMGRKSDKIDDTRDLFSEARDLEWRDLTYNGILQPYAISLKAEGVTSFIYFHPLGVFLIYRKGQYYKISTPLENFTYNLYVGEIIERKGGKFLFLPYDCLRYNNQDIKSQNYLERYQKCQTLYKKTFGDVTIEQKELLVYQRDVASFNQAVSRAFEMRKEVDYGTDGIIFTPINSPYVTLGQRNARNKKVKRVLSNFPDVCKYKLPQDLTIDFLVKEDGVHTNKGLFEGSFKNPVKDWSFQYEKDMIGKIVEFKPHQEGEKIIYKPLRIRDEKPAPNSFYTASRLWELRQRPIQPETLEGKNIKLMRRYHNQIKERLIEKQSGMVIDIGSGKGGDIKKYLDNRKIKEVAFFEPNEDFIEEFNRRIKSFALGNKSFSIIKSGGEETQKIITQIESQIVPKMNGNENWNINMMISLSFFWKDKKMLESLSKTLNGIRELYNDKKYSGKVYFNFLTIEGHRLKRLFEERGNKLQLNNVFLTKIDENEVFIDIKDSETVENQTEYFVFLKELWQESGFSLLDLTPASNQIAGDFILSPNEKTYSDLFVYGSARFYQKDNSISCLEVNENKGSKIDGKSMALGDDQMVKLDSSLAEKLGMDNLYRIATMKKEGSFQHSFLKLINESYREGDVFKRKRFAKKVPIKTFEELPFTSIVLNKDGIKTYNQGKERIIYFLQCDNNEYEPLVRMIDNNVQRIF